MNITEANAARVLAALDGEPVDRIALEESVDILCVRAGKALQMSLAHDTAAIAREYGCPTQGDQVTVGNGKTIWTVASHHHDTLIELDPVEGYTSSSVPIKDWRRMHPVKQEMHT